jgi:multidrug efflux system outer membrane protein
MRVLFGFSCAFFILCALAPLGAAPEDSPVNTGELVLTLEDAVERALEHSVALRQSRLTLEDEEYSSKRLWAEIFPSISASAGVSYRNIPLFTGNAGERRAGAGNFGYSLSAGVDLDLNAGIPYKMKLLNLAYRQELLSYEDTRRLLEIETAQNFYTLIMDRENLSQLDETLGLAEKQLEKHRVGRANGLISEAVLLQSRLAVESARYELSKARADYSVKLGDFLSALGFSSETPVRLEGEFAIRKMELNPEELIRDYLSERPDIKKQRQIIEKLELTERQAAMNRRAPSLNLSFNWGGSPGGSNPINAPFSDNLGGSATLRIPVDPWIPGTKGSQELRRAGTAVSTARLELKNTEDTAAAEIRSLTVSLQNSWESLEIARLREEIARRSYEYSEQGFLSGSVEALALETSRNNMAEARYQLLLGESNYRNQILNLARALNAEWRQFAGNVP